MKVSEAIRHTDVADPVNAGRLQVMGLRWPIDAGLEYRLLDESIEDGGLTVREISESGSVPEIELINNTDADVFAMAGEVLHGAKQNRTLNASVLVSAHTQVRVPVSCVEQGRWRYDARFFRGSGRSSHSKLRYLISRKASESYRHLGRAASDQGEVWQEVSRKLRATGSHSPSASLLQSYKDYEARLEQTISSIRLPGDCSGVAFVIGGRIRGIDVFDKSRTLDRLLPKLLRSYAIDALEEESGDESLSPGAVRSWLQSASEAAFEPYASPGLGEDVRIESEQATGAALCVDRSVLHLELFTKEATD